MRKIRSVDGFSDKVEHDEFPSAIDDKVSSSSKQHQFPSVSIHHPSMSDKSFRCNEKEKNRFEYLKRL